VTRDVYRGAKRVSMSLPSWHPPASYTIGTSASMMVPQIRRVSRDASEVRARRDARVSNRKCHGIIFSVAEGVASLKRDDAFTRRLNRRGLLRKCKNAK